MDFYWINLENCISYLVVNSPKFGGVSAYTTQTFQFKVVIPHKN
jgi:hypothetical protein